MAHFKTASGGLGSSFGSFAHSSICFSLYIALQCDVMQCIFVGHCSICNFNKYNYCTSGLRCSVLLYSMYSVKLSVYYTAFTTYCLLNSLYYTVCTTQHWKGLNSGWLVSFAQSALKDTQMPRTIFASLSQLNTTLISQSNTNAITVNASPLL